MCAVLRLFFRGYAQGGFGPRTGGLPAAARTALLCSFPPKAAQLPVRSGGAHREHGQNRITSTDSLLITPRHESA